MRARCERLIVRHDHDTHIAIGREISKKFVQTLGVIAIEIAAWFIGQQNRRARHQCARNRRALLFSTRHRSRSMIDAPREPDAREQRERSFTGLSIGHTLNAKRHHHVFECRKLAQQMMKLKDKTNGPVAKCSQRFIVSPFDGLPDNLHCSRRWTIKPTQQVQQRALAGTTITHNSNHLPACHFERHIVEHPNNTTVTTDVLLEQSGGSNYRPLIRRTFTHAATHGESRQPGTAWPPAPQDIAWQRLR